MNEVPYWWCSACNQNVFILQAPEVGIFCRQCGHKVEVPKNIPDPIFLDDEDEDWKELPHEDEDETLWQL